MCNARRDAKLMVSCFHSKGQQKEIAQDVCFGNGRDQTYDGISEVSHGIQGETWEEVVRSACSEPLL